MFVDQQETRNARNIPTGFSAGILTVQFVDSAMTTPPDKVFPGFLTFIHRDSDKLYIRVFTAQFIEIGHFSHTRAEELAEYGLDESQRITAKAVYTDSSDKEQTFTVYLGKTDDAGENRYVMVEGSDMVYRISETVAQNMISIEETGK